MRRVVTEIVSVSELTEWHALDDLTGTLVDREKTGATECDEAPALSISNSRSRLIHCTKHPLLARLAGIDHGKVECTRRRERDTQQDQQADRSVSRPTAPRDEARSRTSQKAHNHE